MEGKTRPYLECDMDKTKPARAKKKIEQLLKALGPDLFDKIGVCHKEMFDQSMPPVK